MSDYDAVSLIEKYERIVLFDGVCNLCSGWVQFLINRDPDKKFMFCSVQSEAGIALMNFIGLRTDQIETMAYIDCGCVHLRSTAVFKIVKEMPSAWPLLSVGLIVPRIIRDAVYQFVAQNRYRIAGKKTSCMLPNNDVKARFIEWNITCH